MTVPILSVKNLSVHYQAQQILHSLSFNIQPGEFWGILGPNGSGKTTLLKTIGGWNPPSEGEIKINDKNISEMSRKELALQIALMLAEESFGSFEVTETILMGRYPHQERWESHTKSDLELADFILQEVGLWEKRHRSLHHLSQGERQKVWLARALIQETPLLLLDEPTSHLDIKNQGNIFHFLESFCQNKKLAIISILHGIDLSATFNSHILMLKSGHIIAQGKKEEVFTEENLAALYDLPIQINKTQDNQYSIAPIYRTI
jgi:ABC-type cobalamin/Fe3+-siderophores transport systems, ATPase components